MNKKRFETLPKAAQDIIRKHSGDWAAMRFIQIYGASDAEVMARLQAEPQRSIVLPSQRDHEIAHAAFKSIVAEWAARARTDRDLLNLAEVTIAQLRKAE